MPMYKGIDRSVGLEAPYTGLNPFIHRRSNRFECRDIKKSTVNQLLDRCYKLPYKFYTISYILFCHFIEYASDPEVMEKVINYAFTHYPSVNE